jgi:predicted Zn-dependent protease
MTLRERFFDLADHTLTLRRGGEELLLHFEGEDSDFVRWNGARVRQAGTVLQRNLWLRLIDGGRHAATKLCLGAMGLDDRALVASAVAHLRETVAEAPVDPHLLWNQEACSTERVDAGELPRAEDVVADIAALGAGRDLVGILAQGPVMAGFAAGTGQRNWFQSPSFHFEWCLYCRGDKATKQSYAGRSWSRDGLRVRMEEAVERLELLERPSRRIPPGRYRAWLTPAAMAEIIGLLGWGGFGLKNWRTRRSPLQRSLDGKARFSERFQLVEDTAGGLAPSFSALGFVRPDSVVLIEDGRPKTPLVSPRSAREYGVPTNGAGDSEGPVSPRVGSGTLGRDRVLKELGTGLFVSNLWYLNWSDRAACRATGMTRFATMWVEDGRLQGPVDVMRWDAVLSDLLGDQLVDLGEDVEWMPDAGTYEQRSTSSVRSPGALVDGLEFTL